jgi:flagellar hook-basal body complex protein FliE
MTAPVGLPERFGALLETPQVAPKVGDVTGPAPSGFADQLKDFVGDVNTLQKQAEVKSEAFASGRSNDIHGTMIAVEKAEISLHLLANVRNRVVEMYREVMRMGS